MNKTDYIREVDELHAPDSLKDNISKLKPVHSAKHKRGKKITAIVAACLAVTVLICGVYGVGPSLFQSKSSIEIGDSGTYSYNNSNGAGNANESAGSYGNANAASASSQKLIKKASVRLETKNTDELIKNINSQISSLKGYTSSLNQSKYDGYLTVDTNVCVPAEKLEEFIDFLEKTGTITSKNIETLDVTDNYTNTESQIKALETEEKALLGILAKCETVQDTMSVQERLASVRGELESLRAQKKNYDQRIAYSEILISISEVERVKKTPTGFGSQVKENFFESIYNIGQFFRSLGIFILGESPYIVLIAAVAALVILIVKKKRKKNKQ